MRTEDDCKKLFDLTEKLGEIVEDVEKSINYRFSSKDVLKVFAYTVRKCQVIGKDDDYIPILFEDELKNHVMAKDINARGYLNYLEKKMMEAV